MSREDLIPMNQRTEEEQKRIATLGGKKSGEVRRRKKNMKQQMKLLLSLDACENDRAEMQLLGIPPEDYDNSMVLVKALFLRAAEGDVSAIKEIRNLIGEDSAAATLKLKERELALKERAGEPTSEALSKLDEILRETRVNAETKPEAE